MPNPFVFPALTDTLIRNDVAAFSQRILGVPYPQLQKLIYPQPKYRVFTITKRNGNLRSIAEPFANIKAFQILVLEYLKAKCSPFKPSVHGFVPRRSILTNARAHCSPRTHHILNLDLQDFFPSISFYRIRGVLQSRPFNLSHSVASVVAHLCTVGGSLPQGAPTSPFLSNLVCRSMDRDLQDLARRHKATYTRYADDITFSFVTRNALSLPKNICVEASDGRAVIGAELNDIITVKHNFAINPDKTRLINRSRRMEVTGLTINDRPNVRRIFIDRIRGALKAWETHGYAAAHAAWQAKVAKSLLVPYEKKVWKRQTRTGRTPELRNIIWGKLLYLKMVRGSTDILYNHLAERYNAVVDIEKSRGAFAAPKLPVDPVVRDERAARKAVFVVEWLADFELSSTLGDAVGGQGTAFAYRESNLLITCDHLFEATATIKGTDYPTDVDSPDIKNLQVEIILPNIPHKSWPAKILYRNKQHDVAILCFDGDPPPHKYFNPMPAPITRNTHGILVGYPAYKHWNLPDFNRQSVLNRFLPTRGMNSFTITGAGSIRPGNSGGPFTDLEYRVAGMAQRGSYAGQGHDACLCYEIIDWHIQNWRSAAPPTVTGAGTPIAAPPPVAAASAITGPVMPVPIATIPTVALSPSASASTPPTTGIANTSGSSPPTTP